MVFTYKRPISALRTPNRAAARPGAPRLQGRMGCGVRKRRGVQAALGTYPGAQPLATRWRGFFGTGRSKPHDMGAHLAGRPRERLLRPECSNYYTAHIPTETTRPTHPPEKSMSGACTGLSPPPTPPNHARSRLCTGTQTGKVKPWSEGREKGLKEGPHIMRELSSM